MERREKYDKEVRAEMETSSDSDKWVFNPVQVDQMIKGIETLIKERREMKPEKKFKEEHGLIEKLKVLGRMWGKCHVVYNAHGKDGEPWLSCEQEIEHSVHTEKVGGYANLSGVQDEIIQWYRKQYAEKKKEKAVKKAINQRLEKFEKVKEIEPFEIWARRRSESERKKSEDGELYEVIYKEFDID